jgi:hypothetical protein
MSEPINLERCRAFVECQLRPAAWPAGFEAAGPAKRAVTISRQAGCGARLVAGKLAEYLQARAPHDAPPWTVFDRNLVEAVLQDHHLPQRLAKFMPEDRFTELEDILDELFGLHPPSWLLVRKTSETILRLAELGQVILVGRGANLITARLANVLHVRLVGSLQRRVERIQLREQLGRRPALALVRKEDRGRRRYVQKYFRTDIDEPLSYHLVINTDLVSATEAACWIGEAVLGGRTAQRERTRGGVASRP